MKTKWAQGAEATNAYRNRLLELAKPGMRVLHAGCGWDKNRISSTLSNKCEVVGIDLDPRVQGLFHSEFHLGSLDAMPFGQSTFDLIFSEYVFEHLEKPERVFAEMARVLKSGGSILVLTPNLYSYKTLAARITPQWFHVAVGRHRYGRGHEQDMYPTLYRCNTRRKFFELGTNAGLSIRRVNMVTNGPTWFERIPGVFGGFDLFHTAIRKWGWASELRCALIVELYKP